MGPVATPSGRAGRRPPPAGNLARVTADAPSSTVLAATEGTLGRLTLNRPRAINALDLGMIRTLTATLERWRDDPAIRVVVLDGAGERGFCAGGDVRGLREHIETSDPEQAADFFRAEYALNALIAEYPHPVVALADGVTMGGGIGLAGHARIRVVTERSRLAMPETRIGLTPDVGGSWLLAHAPGRLGEYLGLTGEVMDAGDAIHAGFADHFVPSDRLDALTAALATVPADAVPGDVEAVVASFAEPAPESSLVRARRWIDDAFQSASVPEILERLRGRRESEALAAADTLEELSPTSLAVTLSAVRSARELPDLRAALAQEYALVMWFVRTQPDLPEGIRAQLVDKDRSPRWSPATLADVPADLAATALGFQPVQPLWE